MRSFSTLRNFPLLIISEMRSFIEQLDRRLQQPLPGPEAQYRMAHAVRRTDTSPPEGVRRAGVMALFFPKGTSWHIALIERQSHNPDDRHRGQIGFPGGRYEQGDGSMRTTALRETEEEIGVDRSAIQVLGALTELYIPVSNFLVSPYVGYVAHTPRFRPQESEVKAVLEVPFELFLDRGNIRTIDLKISEHITLNDVPYFHIQGKVVWGATAMMLSELLEVLQPGLTSAE